VCFKTLKTKKTGKRDGVVSETTLNSQSPIYLRELKTDWREKTLWLWNSSFACKRRRLEM